MPQSFKEYLYSWKLALGELGLGSSFATVFKRNFANFKRNFSSLSPTAKILTFAAPVSLTALAAPAALAATQKGAEQLKKAVEKKSPEAARLIGQGIDSLTKGIQKKLK